MTPLNDQVFAGALMWLFGTFVYLLPAVILTVKLLAPRTGVPQIRAPPKEKRRITPSDLRGL
jgi:hypothetical protein